MPDILITVVSGETTELGLSIPGVQGPVGQGFPSGGTVGQLVVKQSATNYDTAWTASISGITINSSIASGLTLQGTVSGGTFVSSTLSGATVNAPAMSGGTINNATLSGSTVDACTIVNSTVSGTTIFASTLSGVVTNVGTVSGGTFAAPALSGATINAGTAALPGLTIAGDPNTGIYSPGADLLAIATGGVERLRVDANGAIFGAPTGDVRLEVGQGATANRNAYIDFVTDTTYADYGLRLIRGNTGANSVSQLEQRGTGELCLATLDAAPLTFYTNNTERARIDSSGRLLVGTSTALTGTGGLVDKFQVVNGSISVSSYSANEFGNRIQFTKSRNATTGSQTVVQSGDTLGYLEWAGSDGTNFQLGARITAQVDGTPGADDMPGRLVFSVTADGAATPTERMRITSAGVLQIADAGDITVGTTTGTKIGTATTQKIGFYNATPVVQPTAVADATDAATVITQLNALLAKLRTLGIIAT